MTAAIVGDAPKKGGLPVGEDVPMDGHMLATSAPEHSPRAPLTRSRAGLRLFSESDADSANLAKKKARRRRGKGRWKPYHNMTTAEKMAKDEREERNAVQKRARLFSHGKPMAPYNTTQFLLEDHERRATADSDGDSINGGRHSPSLRCRAMSGSDPGGNSSESGSTSGEFDELFDREFEAEYDNVNIVRIDSMSRDEVTREMICLERNNGKLVSRVGDLQLENEKLKRLLEENNIVYEGPSTRRRRSGESFASESGAVTA